MKSRRLVYREYPHRDSQFPSRITDQSSGHASPEVCSVCGCPWSCRRILKSEPPPATGIEYASPSQMRMHITRGHNRRPSTQYQNQMCIAPACKSDELATPVSESPLRVTRWQSPQHQGLTASRPRFCTGQRIYAWFVCNIPKQVTGNFRSRANNCLRIRFPCQSTPPKLKRSRLR